MISFRTVSTVSDKGDYCQSTLSLESCNFKISPPVELVEKSDYSQTAVNQINEFYDRVDEYMQS